MIVGFIGFIGAGKDTAADFLVNSHGFRRDSFANTLKDAVSNIFRWDRTLLEGRTKESREWREQVDEWWSTRLNIPHLTPRWVLQNFGTNVCRNAFHDDIWIASLENKIRNTRDNIVITDVRFPNELTAIKNSGGLIVRIKRGTDPEWVQAAIDFNKGPNNNHKWALGRKALEDRNIHASEYSWVGAEVDYEITNDSTLENLFAQLEHLLLPVAKVSTTQLVLDLI